MKKIKKIINVMLLILVCGNIVLGQIKGQVKDKEGKVLPNVLIASREYGYGEVEVNESGNFQLTKPRNEKAIIFFIHQGYKPVMKIIDIETKDLDIVLEKLGEEVWIIPKCSLDNKSSNSQTKTYNLFSESFGNKLFFYVPQKMEIHRNQDVDYVGYYISYEQKNEKAYMSGILGTNASFGLPSDDLILASKNIKVKVLKIGEGEFLDILGQTISGNFWRFIGSYGIVVAEYSRASQQQANYFDSIISTLCFKE